MEKDTKFKIEKGIPISSSKSKEVKYPFKDMEVGDSFLTNDSGPDVLNSCRKYKKQINSPFKIVTRTMSDGKIRAWRVL